ncbi:hypothetical protein FQZ97_506160 [compost metagenome]
MSCLICRGPATEFPTIGDRSQYSCPECGIYQVSRTLLTLVGDRVFDVEATLERLAHRHDEGEMPILTSADLGLAREA